MISLCGTTEESNANRTYLFCTLLEIRVPALLGMKGYQGRILEDFTAL